MQLVLVAFLQQVATRPVLAGLGRSFGSVHLDELDVIVWLQDAVACVQCWLNRVPHQLLPVLLPEKRFLEGIGLRSVHFPQCFLQILARPLLFFCLAGVRIVDYERGMPSLEMYCLRRGRIGFQGQALTTLIKHGSDVRRLSLCLNRSRLQALVAASLSLQSQPWAEHETLPRHAQGDLASL